MSDKKYPIADNQESTWPHESDITDASDKKLKDKDPKKNAKLPKSSYQSKKFDNRSYKEKPGDNAPQQEYSMGFAVNPKDSRKNYYSANYNRRYYSDYRSYYNYGPNNGSGGKYASEYDNDANFHYQDSSYYSQEYYPQYDKDVYSSGKFTNKRNAKNNSSEVWRSGKDDKSSSGAAAASSSSNARANTSDASQQKPPNRGTRKSDKRQFSSEFLLRTSNDNDLPAE